MSLWMLLYKFKDASNSSIRFNLKTVNIPKIEKPSDNHGSSYEYLEEDVQDQTYQAVLEKSYNIFRVCFTETIQILYNRFMYM